MYIMEMLIWRFLSNIIARPIFWSVLQHKRQDSKQGLPNAECFLGMTNWLSIHRLCKHVFGCTSVCILGTAITHLLLLWHTPITHSVTQPSVDRLATWGVPEPGPQMVDYEGPFSCRNVKLLQLSLFIRIYGMPPWTNFTSLTAEYHRR